MIVVLNINLSTRYVPIKSNAKIISRIASFERRHHRMSNAFNRATVNGVNNTLSKIVDLKSYLVGLTWMNVDLIYFELQTTSKRMAFFF